jgi:hypothetical protein
MLLGLGAQLACGAPPSRLVPPAVPLVACDPYFSIWSTGKALTDVDTTHWTGRPHRLVSLIRIDGKTYRLIGSRPEQAPAMRQTGLEITPTRSIYRFEDAGLRVELIFMTPALPQHIDQLSRPVTYLTYNLQSIDEREHEAEIYFSVAGELTVNEPRQQVSTSLETFGQVAALRIGSSDQPILERKGDDLRIDWGYVYLAAGRDVLADRVFGPSEDLENGFLAGEEIHASSENVEPRPANQVAGAIFFDPFQVGATGATRWLVLAYDDLFAIEYMHKQLRPYWRRNGLEASGLLQESIRDYASLVKRCEAFDRELSDDLTRAGESEYAQLAALAYRQCFAAGKFVADANGQPLQFSKENHSNGCIATADVFYPMSPQFLLFGPSLAKSFLVPFMNYAASDRWTFPFAPHDLGTYPKANGQVYGGGERSERNQMPVEESGNLLILMAAVARMEGNAEFADLYWPQLEQWAEYLKQEGFDPGNQLCTDDFAGHLAHNVNLSVKAICGLGAFSQLCQLRGDEQLASDYRRTAEQFAAQWIVQADDGDHFRLAFDKPGTWSQKYNLVWDQVLELKLFPDEVRRKEMDFYLAQQNRYGLPLDNRRAYTKLDWILWTATLTQNREDFTALVQPVMRFLHETPDRVPMTDWYQTRNGRRVGFTARPVVGGVFMRMLYDETVWRKWAARDETDAGGFAPLPLPPKIVLRLPAANEEPALWRYSFERPEGNWSSVDYDDSQWSEGRSGFGTPQTPGSHVETTWDSRDIWLRRQFSVEGSIDESLQLFLHHDEDAEVFINGVLARRVEGYTTDYEAIPMRQEAVDALKPTGNVLAVHCRQTSGGQYIDVGLVTIEPVER